MLDWLLEHDAEESSKAIQSTLKDTVRTKTQDDCSIAILRRELKELNSIAAAERQATLGLVRADGLANMIKVLELAAMGESLESIMAKTKLGRSTVYRHLALLKSLGHLS